MKVKFKYITAIIILLGIAIASEAGTIKPFVRSRYSLRWRKTTEMPKVLEPSTTHPLREGVEKTSIKPTEVPDSATDNSIQVTTSENLIKTSTHATDYDYYNNEVEEGEHKN